jgi:FkbM family methyltransferase
VTPKRHRLALYYWARRFIAMPEAEAYRMSSLASREGIAVDVGANWGLYTYAMSRACAEVVAFEPNPDASTMIRAACLSNVRLLDVALSSKEGTARLHMRVRDGVELASWGSLLGGRMAGESTVATREVRVMRLDDLGLKGVSFIKIDVEGHELDVLEGARRTIAKSLPACLVEASDETLPAVSAFFSGISPGYGRKTDIAGVSISPGNYLFRISDRVGRTTDSIAERRNIAAPALD